MANNYYQGNGLIHLKMITPIIQALFGVFEVAQHNEGSAYICKSESNISYMGVAECVNDCILDGSVPFEGEEFVKQVFFALAEKLGKLDAVKAYINPDAVFEPDEDAELEFLFGLAQILDDGHGIKSILFDGAWTCDRPRLGEFGGDGEYVGKAYSVGFGSFTTDHLGPTVNNALLDGDIELAASALTAHFNRVLDGIADASQRIDVAKRIMRKLNK